MSADAASTPHSPLKSLACISGLGFRLPQANDIDELSYTLKAGHCNLADPRWPPGVFGMRHKCGRLDSVGEMDCQFFNVSPLEAFCSNHMLGPLLEVVAECIMDSGLTFAEVSHRKTGFYLGMTQCDTDYIKTGPFSSPSEYYLRQQLPTQQCKKCKRQ
ncbi:fatty acid synthase-like [Aplysia californica]|uniref:Fatty acid synthase-like n=1 Tax=Aplysia californica TaxID=6500 RepID=A0ABM0ZWI6_APLCA|nr:fatty acid synthase-like [Aplysia californica]